jgi:hypothetical protein
VNKLPPFFFSYNPSFAAKFWEKVNKNGPYSEECGSKCWEWIGYRDELGYGIVGAHVSFDGKTVKKAYRLSYILWYGEIPEKAHFV